MSNFDSQIVLDWWNKLKDDSGSRAELRRASGPTEVVFQPVFHELVGKLESAKHEALACVSGLCAHVKEHAGGSSLAKQMAEYGKISDLRFRRLLAILNLDDLYRVMIRIIRLLGNSVNIASLAEIVYWWNDRTKKELAFEYYKYLKE